MVSVVVSCHQNPSIIYFLQQHIILGFSNDKNQQGVQNSQGVLYVCKNDKEFVLNWCFELDPHKHFLRQDGC